jgi:hypothetical protein
MIDRLNPCFKGLYMRKIDFNSHNHIGFIKVVENGQFQTALLLFRMEHGVQVEG